MADLHVTSLTLDHAEHYVLVWRESERAEVLRTVGRWASDPELSLTWRHAAAMLLRAVETVSAGDLSDIDEAA